MVMQGDDHFPKRRKLDHNLSEEALAPPEHPPRKGVDRPISPPPSKRQTHVTSAFAITSSWSFENVPKEKRSPDPQPEAKQDTTEETASVGDENTKYMSSPFQLTQIQNMAPWQNLDTVGLKDILGNPLIKECWNFNFLFDVDFVMKHFDEDVRDMVKVKMIHGFWKNDDARRIALLEAAERYPNVQLLHAYIPDPFGTHHSKMLVLFTHDDQAQVVIHTANMISRDWSNMTQAVWRSPLLPLLPPSADADLDVTTHPIGSGERFKVDILRYLDAYGKRIDSLPKQLRDYDFSSIQAAFIGSAPSRQKPAAAKPDEQTSFGWLGLQEILASVPMATKSRRGCAPHIVMQVSSIATLGAAPTWITQFQSVLACSGIGQATKVAKPSRSSFFSKQESPTVKQDKPVPPTFNIIFPTPDEIRMSLDGYVSGGSIHMKLQSQQQQKQLEYLHPLFCHWKAVRDSSSMDQRQGQALRGTAAPHIKTYVRFSDRRHETIDWAMVTSANLSKQAWGDVVSKKDEIWIQSWEAGVVVWPALFAEQGAEDEAIIVPVFGKDLPDSKDLPCLQKVEDDDQSSGESSMEKQSGQTVVGFRMPYDLPLTSYAPSDKPWCATMQYSQPDRMGRTWEGYQPR